MLNPTWLKTFRTLIDVGHFTQTAETLHMTQPGVSQHIKKLESACKHSLIKREGKSFELTEQGRMVYQYALTLANNEAMLVESLSFDNPFSGQCKIACSGSLALRLYPELITLQQTHSDLSIHLEAAPNHKILNDLQTGVIDLGIVTHIPTGSLFQSKTIGNETLCLVLPRSFDNERITAEKLIECGLISHPDANHYLSLYFDLCGDKELENMNLDDIPHSGHINQLSQILLPVAKGIGFTVIPQGAIDSFQEKEQLHIVSTQSPVNETLYMVQKRHRNLPARYDTIADLLDQTLSSNTFSKPR
ncbi:LysR family transcriptional regulator [Vibrio genomosp. F10 str. 9ZC157]|uniref:LysR family transcriptional regulator n=1 Tax=Vibrio genomosp. F10 str. ZF-129 TaxID=1187848 RepID=A0A1E5BIU5_9VIBR|nr:LysR family transcriptional regulator [Vibrio genomosp. F10]OEE37359.1 LysR family transcriptional regulator [Vibrio genomosp. F10 str. ZF-129]OEE95189.1 LysR family transcriptional regulator [Vibrio genomosp. F10 str. 9ZC157]